MVEVAERDIETVIPKAGERVMVLFGEHRGQVGKILQKQADKEVVIVQLEEDLDLVTLSFDDVAEYSR
jgi:ribosomal protein S4E